MDQNETPNPSQNTTEKPQEKASDPLKIPLFEGFTGGLPGLPRTPGSGRKPGSLNKKTLLSIDLIREQVAAELGKTPEQVTATRILYLIANRGDKQLGLKEGEITLEQAIDAASKLMNFEVPKKRSIEVTGLELTGGSQFVISTGNNPPPKESEEEWAARAERETAEAEAEIKRQRLAELERQKAEEIQNKNRQQTISFKKPGE